jgi:hypothetical protein
MTSTIVQWNQILKVIRDGDRASKANGDLHYTVFELTLEHAEFTNVTLVRVKNVNMVSM